ncbi:ATPase [Oscillibacter sp. MSJ-2]|uniref:ATPase n=1 Tax=Dysosmobacter acutus TaxID=2841504 RepID=A0ABS6F7P6_9FIRM|nr:V-type ATPase 116kDa subunit family protein [Dysosmobacter acutus]MBU5626075.1 ATPase [Dysosmobacter acutus]
MSIEKMTLVQLTGKLQVLDEALLRLTEIPRFHPEQPFQLSGKVKGFSPISQENPYKPLLQQLTDLAQLTGFELRPDPDSASAPPSPEEMRASLSALKDQFDKLSDYRKKLTGFAEENKDALALLERLQTLDADVDDIFSCEYVKVRFGRLPTDSYRKLDYYTDQLFVFVSLTEDEEYCYGFYFTTEEVIAEIDDLFASLYFERIWVPKTIHGTPEAARESLERSLEQTNRDLETVNEKLTEIMMQNSSFILSAYTRLSALNRTFEYRKYVGAYHDMFHITGFIPTADEPLFAERFAGLGNLSVDFRPHDSDRRFQTPTLLKNNWFCRPFELFVEMYGIPSYEELDPTAFLALSYTLLFGIMFGDLGQGLCIALLGFFLARCKGMEFGRILSRIGLSSALFGLLYGSVFGLENALNPLYHALGFTEKPIEIMSPVTMNNLLFFAIGLGVVLIVASICMNIVLGLRAHDVERAFFSQNGLAGLIFYGAVLTGVVSMVMGRSLFGNPILLSLCILPILVIFLKEPLGRLIAGSRPLPPGVSPGGFLVEGFFELLEVLLSFVTNTMSFLRVGGFVISHAGMMAVVLTLTEMMRGSGSILTFIGGNLFVMALEGFIVGIQVLRLEFYEMFSHYFEGQGIPFVSIAAESQRP